MRVRVYSIDLKILKELVLDVERIISVNVEITNQDVDILIQEKNRGANDDMFDL